MKSLVQILSLIALIGFAPAIRADQVNPQSRNDTRFEGQGDIGSLADIFRWFRKHRILSEGILYAGYDARIADDRGDSASLKITSRLVAQCFNEEVYNDAGEEGYLGRCRDDSAQWIPFEMQFRIPANDSKTIEHWRVALVRLISNSLGVTAEFITGHGDSHSKKEGDFTGLRFGNLILNEFVDLTDSGSVKLILRLSVGGGLLFPNSKLDPSQDSGTSIVTQERNDIGWEFAGDGSVGLNIIDRVLLEVFGGGTYRTDGGVARGTVAVTQGEFAFSQEVIYGGGEVRIVVVPDLLHLKLRAMKIVGSEVYESDVVGGKVSDNWNRWEFTGGLELHW